MSKTISAAVTGLPLTALVLFTSAYAHASTTSSTTTTSNTSALCPVIIRVANLESNRVGNMRRGPTQDRAWADYTTSTHALAALATDPALKQDLALITAGMARISAEPGHDLDDRMDHLSKHDPTYYASVEATFDRIEPVCGAITGEL